MTPGIGVPPGHGAGVRRGHGVLLGVGVLHGLGAGVVPVGDLVLHGAALTERGIQVATVR